MPRDQCDSRKSFPQTHLLCSGSVKVTARIQEQAYISKDSPRHEGWVLFSSFVGHHVPITNVLSAACGIKQGGELEFTFSPRSGR